MQSILENYRYQLSRSICNYRCIFCIIFVTLLCFTSNIYIDPMTTQEFSVIEVLMKVDKSELLSDFSLININVISAGCGDYLKMFFPILASYPFVTCFCEERRNGFIKYRLIRGNKRAYYLGSIVSSLCVGGFIASVGFLIYALLVYFLFPNPSQFGQDTFINNPLFENSFVIYLILQILLIFIYGAISSLAAFFVCCITTNEYIACCVSFLAVYIVDGIRMFMIREKINYSQWIFSPSSLVSFPYLSSENKSLICCETIVYIVVICLLFQVIMNRRRDFAN